MLIDKIRELMKLDWDDPDISALYPDKDLHKLICKGFEALIAVDDVRRRGCEKEAPTHDYGRGYLAAMSEIRKAIESTEEKDDA